MSDLINDFFGFDPSTPSKSSRGGYRPNAGRKAGHKSATADTPEDALTDYQRLERARADKEEQLARKEKVKADLAEGAVVNVLDVEMAAARAFSACSAALDAIGDMLERDGYDTEICIKVTDLVNQAKAQLAKDLEKTHIRAILDEVEDEEDEG